MALVACGRQPKLLECTQQSILKSVMQSAELGLDCSGTLGRGWLVPYYNNKIKSLEAQFIPGYQGLIDLARRGGQIARIESRVVYENDRFELAYGTDQNLTHIPELVKPRGNMVCVYAIAELKDGSQQIDVMTLEQIEGIRNRSKAKDGGPWKTDYDEMARKTVIRRISKYLPLSIELAKAIEIDDQQYDGNVEIINSLPPPVPNGERTTHIADEQKDRFTAPADAPLPINPLEEEPAESEMPPEGDKQPVTDEELRQRCDSMLHELFGGDAASIATAMITFSAYINKYKNPVKGMA